MSRQCEDIGANLKRSHLPGGVLNRGGQYLMYPSSPYLSSAASDPLLIRMQLLASKVKRNLQYCCFSPL